MSKDWFEEAKALSAYHFDKNRMDPRFDSAVGLGNFSGDWDDEVENAIANCQPVSMAIRGNNITTKYSESDYHKGTPIKNTQYDYEKEFFDKVNVDYDNYTVLTKTAEFGPKMQKMIDMFCFGEPYWHTLHCQLTGQVFPYHIDVFHRRSKIAHIDPSKILRVVVMLRDWEPGHFYGYGNYNYQGWKAGDFHTFNHADTPHYTANASYKPRVLLLLTGVKTQATEEFLWRARSTPSIEI
jgi:hypothetical protein